MVMLTALAPDTAARVPPLRTATLPPTLLVPAPAGSPARVAPVRTSTSPARPAPPFNCRAPAVTVVPPVKVLTP